MPLDDLNIIIGVSAACGKGIGEKQSAHWVATLIGTMRVHLASRIISLDVDQILVDVTGNLDVVRSFDVLEASDGALGDNASAMAGLCAPGYGFTLGCTDFRVWFGRAPEAEVVDRVDDRSLAARFGPLGGRVANIVAVLGTTLSVTRIGLIWKGCPFETLASEGSLCVDDGGTGEDGGGECGRL
jgi:hypothetical protein